MVATYLALLLLTSNLRTPLDLLFHMRIALTIRCMVCSLGVNVCTHAAAWVFVWHGHAAFATSSPLTKLRNHMLNLGILLLTLLPPSLLLGKANGSEHAEVL